MPFICGDSGLNTFINVNNYVSLAFLYFLKIFWYAWFKGIFPHADNVLFQNYGKDREEKELKVAYII